MMSWLESGRRLFQSLFRCTATGRRAFSTTLASDGMYDDSIGSTDASASLLARVGVVGPTRARFSSADWREEVGTNDADGRGPRSTSPAFSSRFCFLHLS
jgi:hypothetical protein